MSDAFHSDISIRCPNSFYAVELVTRVPLIIVDTLVLVLTWTRTYRQIVDSRRLGISIPLSNCLARDGKRKTFRTS